MKKIKRKLKAFFISTMKARRDRVAEMIKANIYR